MPVYRQWVSASKGKLTMVPCGRRTCPFCGPNIRTAQACHYTDCFDKVGDPVYVHEVTASDSEALRKAWRALNKRIERGGHLHVRCPVSKTGVVVFTTLAVGEQVTDDLEGQLRDALFAIPAYSETKMRLSPSPCMKLPDAKSPDDLKTFPVASKQRFDAMAALLQRILNRTDYKTEIEAPELNTDESTAVFEILGIGEFSKAARRKLNLGPRRPRDNEERQ